MVCTQMEPLGQVAYPQPRNWLVPGGAAPPGEASAAPPMSTMQGQTMQLVDGEPQAGGSLWDPCGPSHVGQPWDLTIACPPPTSRSDSRGRTGGVGQGVPPPTSPHHHPQQMGDPEGI